MLKRLNSLVVIALMTVPMPVRAGVEERIHWIRTEYYTTQEELSSYTEYSFHWLDGSTEGAEVVGYVSEDDNEIKCMVATFYGEMGKRKIWAYYSDHEPYFVLDQIFSYESPFASDPARLEEWRYYFDGPQIIRILDPEKMEISSSTKGAEIYELAHDILKKLKRW